MAGVALLVWRFNDQIIVIINERKVHKIGDGIDREDLMPSDVRPAEPAARFSSAGHLWISGCVIGPVIIILERIEPSVGLKFLVTVVDFPHLFLARFSKSQPDPVSLIIGWGTRIIHEFTAEFERKLPGIKWEAVQLVNGGRGADDRIIVIFQESIGIAAVSRIVKRLQLGAERVFVIDRKCCQAQGSFNFRSPLGLEQPLSAKDDGVLTRRGGGGGRGGADFRGLIQLVEHEYSSIAL